MDLGIPVRDFSVSATLHGESGTVVALAPGAGSTRALPALVALAESIAASGRRALLYNFPYADRGVRRPDPPAVLEMTTAGVAAYARDVLHASRVVLGGRSMGGRIASQAIARGQATADGVVLLGYPLHPPQNPRARRDRHLPAVSCPLLFVQGTRDAFAPGDSLPRLVERLGTLATLVPIAEADHSFAVLKRSGRSAAEVESEIHGAVLAWLAAHRL